MSVTRDSNVSSLNSREHLSTLNWRFEFENYVQTRYFLEQMANLSERMKYYPDMSFGKTYVNITIDAAGQALLAKDKADFIKEMQTLSTMKLAYPDQSVELQ